jgi:hypothetical protein
MERETERWEDGGCCVIKYLLLFFFILVLSSNVSEVGSFVLISFFSFRSFHLISFRSSSSYSFCSLHSGLEIFLHLEKGRATIFCTSNLGIRCDCPFKFEDPRCLLEKQKKSRMIMKKTRTREKEITNVNEREPKKLVL